MNLKKYRQLNPNYEWRLSFRAPAAPQRPSGHVSLKQTAHLRSHSSVNRSEVLSYLQQRNNNSTGNFNEPSNSLSAATPKTSTENGGVGYVPYSPYALRRRDSITRPFSPASGTQAVSNSRPYSPSYRQFQATEYNYEKRLQASNGGLNGYRSYSPYRTLAEAEARPYSPYCGRDSSRERWQTLGPRSLSPFARDYSPWRRENVDPPVIQLPVQTNDTKYTTSSIAKQRFEHISAATQNVYASPMLSRKR